MQSKPDRLFCDGRQKGATVFSQWTDDVDDPSTPELTVLELNSYSLDSPVMYAIDVWGWEVARKVTANSGPIGLTPEGQLQTNENHFSRLKVQIGWHSASGGTIRNIDIAHGSRFTVHSNYVAVRMMVPVNHWIGPSLNRPAGGGQRTFDSGLVLTTSVGSYIAPTQSTYGGRIATNTITVRIPANTADQEVRVPPGTRTVSVFQTQDGNPAVLQWLLASGGPSVGQLEVPIDRRIRDTERPGNAQFISTGPADNDTRDITFVFGLEI